MIGNWARAGSCAVVAHRGGSLLGPANTIETVVMAAAAGADAVEIDLHELGDGTLVLVHDGKIRRRGRRVPLREVDIVRLSALTGDPPVLLEALIERMEDLPTGLYLDIKAVTTGGLRRALDLLCSSSLAERTVVGSFDIHRVREVAEDGRLPASVLYRDNSIDPVALAGRTGCAVVHPCFDDEPWMVDRLAGEWMDKAHATGLTVISWNSNDPGLLTKMVAAGFDAICTDDPRLLRDH